MPARSRSLGFPCPTCGLEYGSISIEEHEKSCTEKNKERKNADVRTHAIGKTHEAYNKNKERIELKSAAIALKNIIISKSEEFIASSFEDPRFIRISNLLSDIEKQKLNAIVKNIVSSVQTRKMAEQKEIEEEGKKYSKWNVTEELDINSREYRMMKKIHKLNTASIILGLQDGEDFQEKIGEDGKVIVCWNPIIEIKRYRRMGDPILHLDLKSMVDFISSKITIECSDEVAKYFSAKNVTLMKKAFKVIYKYKEPFYSKNWDYPWFEWFWIVRYSEAEAPKKAIRMLQALDGEKRRISLKQIKNKSQETLDFLEKFFYCNRLIILFVCKIVQLITEKDSSLKKEYEDLLKKRKQEDEGDIGKIVNKRWEEMTVYNKNNKGQGQGQIQYNTNDAIDDNEDFVVKRKTRRKRIRIYHYVNGRRKRCGPFNLSELPIVAIAQLYKEGRINKYN